MRYFTQGHNKIQMQIWNTYKRNKSKCHDNRIVLCDLGVTEPANWWGHKNRRVWGFLFLLELLLLSSDSTKWEKNKGKWSSVKTHFHSLCDGLKAISKICIFNKKTPRYFELCSWLRTVLYSSLLAFSKSLQGPATGVAPLKQCRSGRTPPISVTARLFWTAVALQTSLSICHSYNDE